MDDRVGPFDGGGECERVEDRALDEADVDLGCGAEGALAGDLDVASRDDAWVVASLRGWPERLPIQDLAPRVEDRVEEKIGAGGMGEVYRAHDTTLGRDVALKILPPEFSADPDRLARFAREAKLLASLNHPNIAAIYGFETTDEATFLAMELVRGVDLLTHVRGRAPGALDEERLRDALRQLAVARLGTGDTDGPTATAGPPDRPRPWLLPTAALDEVRGPHSTFPAPDDPALLLFTGGTTGTRASSRSSSATSSASRSCSACSSAEPSSARMASPTGEQRTSSAKFRSMLAGG